MKKRRLSVLLALCMVLTMMPAGAWAASGGNEAFTVTGGTSGTDYTYTGGVLTVLTGTQITIANTDSGIATTDKIVVSSGVTANITLNGVNIDVSSSNDACAFDMTGAAVNLTLIGENKLKSGSSKAGLQVPQGAAVTIGGIGSLIATGGRGQGGAGIGGAFSTSCGAVTINGGTITATGGGSDGGHSGAGIGGGGSTATGGGGGSVTINGGIVTAIGSENGAGIGGGGSGNSTGGNGGTITINGGTIIARGGEWRGAGIGGGGGVDSGAGAAVTINGGSVKAIAGGNGAAIIGAGADGNIAGTENGSLQNATSHNVYLYTLTLPAISTTVTALTLPGSYSYGITDMKTDSSGMLYLYLPADIKGGVTVTATTGTYSGTISNYAATLTPAAQVGSWGELNTAISNAAINALTTIEITKSFSKDNTTILISPGKNITIQSTAGGPYTITQINDENKANSTFFRLNAGTLTLKNIILDGANIPDVRTVIEIGGVSGYDNGTFIMDSGAEIRNVKAKHSGVRAGAVSNLTGTFIMKAESVITNCENTPDKTGVGGVLNLKTFIMEGGSVTNSKGEADGGGGVYNRAGTITLSGEVNISGNTLLASGEASNLRLLSDQIITMAPGGLSPDSHIGVYMYINNGDAVAITGTNSADYSSYFFSDNARYSIRNSGTGENQIVQLVVRPSLSALSLSSGTLSPVFASGTTSYTASVGNEVGSITVTPTVADSGATVTVSGTAITSGNASGAISLNVGANTIPVVVTAQDGTTTKTYTVTVTRAAAPSGGPAAPSGGSSSISSQPPQSPVLVIVNGQEQDAGKETKTTEDGRSMIIVEMKNDVIDRKIDEAIKSNTAGTGNVIQVPIADTKSEAAKVELTGDLVKKLEQNNFDVSVKRDNIEYKIAAEEFTISKVAETLGVKETNLEEIKVEVKITRPDEEAVAKYNEVAKSNGAALVIPPISFEVVAKAIRADGSTGEVVISRFSSYVERVMEIPAGVDSGKITTGIVFNPDGTFSHVPTNVFQKDGKWYAKINSLTNSTYALIYNEVAFADAQGRWYEQIVSEMASRKIINGKSETSFDGRASITRAEFAAILIRALGLTDNGAANFSDVKNRDWYYGSVGTAVEYSLVNGYMDGSFKPEAAITRLEAMIMVQRAAKIADYAGTTGSLAPFSDARKIDAWARSAAEFNVGSGLIVGNDGKLRPGDKISRAETATVILRLLQKAELVDVRTKI